MITERTPGELKIGSKGQMAAVWPDGHIIFQSLDVCIIENLPNSLKLPKQVQKLHKFQTKTIPNISKKI